MSRLLVQNANGWKNLSYLISKKYYNYKMIKEKNNVNLMRFIKK